MFAYGVDSSGLRGEQSDNTLPGLETSSINSGYSGERVAIVLFNLRFEKIKKEIFSEQNDQKNLDYFEYRKDVYKK